MTTEGPHLVVETSSGRYAIPAQRVRQVLWLPVLAEAEPERRGQIGTAHIEDEEVPVVDLDLALGAEPEPYTLDHRVVDVALDGDRVGVVAADVVDVVELTEEDLVQRELEGGAVVAVAETPNGLAEVLDPQALADQPPAAEPPPAELFDAFDREELAELAKRQRRGARPQRAAPAEAEEAAAIAEVGAGTLAIPLDEVVGFVRIEAITPVPHTPDHVLGLTNHRGEIVTVVDPGPSLDLEHGSPSPELGALVELRESLAAIALDRVGRTITIDEDAIDEEGARPGVRGLVPVDGQPVPLLDVRGLLSSDRVVVDEGAIRP